MIDEHNHADVGDVCIFAYTCRRKEGKKKSFSMIMDGADQRTSQLIKEKVKSHVLDNKTQMGTKITGCLVAGAPIPAP